MSSRACCSDIEHIVDQYFSLSCGVYSVMSTACAVQFYGTNEGASPVFFGDASSKKFGTYFVKDGKVMLSTWQKTSSWMGFQHCSTAHQ